MLLRNFLEDFGEIHDGLIVVFVVVFGELVCCVDVRNASSTAHWNIDPKNKIPLSFSTYLDWADCAFRATKSIMLKIAGYDCRKAGMYMRRIREKIAATIVKHQSYILNDLNRMNRSMSWMAVLECCI